VAFQKLISLTWLIACINIEGCATHYKRAPDAGRVKVEAMLKMVSLGALLLMAIGIVGLLLRHSLMLPRPVVIGVQCAALTLMVWARLTLGRRSFHAAASPTPGGLVTTGPYRFIRHPIYMAACMIGWAGVLGNWSTVVNALLGGLLLLGALGRMLCEEQLVAVLYLEYRGYAQSSKRIVPFIF
jgi:protein-S-isoprenylcysteine O-methyltransferase Ste14